MSSLDIHYTSDPAKIQHLSAKAYPALFAAGTLALDIRGPPTMSPCPPESRLGNPPVVSPSRYCVTVPFPLRGPLDDIVGGPYERMIKSKLRSRTLSFMG